ncbi:hypothetical protein CPLU01_09518 [Colletotrichum plurivorum]|uniref:Uncharacterized protein n=1 Tax=Colletotrichum plurivorum TaxID=2175906 RepID=A0A8H6K8H1_9PEZI|nr:hypothetical protein CPLU01_09518 [Colletotrichum plurivorum]
MAKLTNLPPELLFEISSHLRPAPGFTKRRIWDQRLETWPGQAEPEPDHLTSLSCTCKQLRNVLFPRAVFHSVVLCGPGSFGRLLALVRTICRRPDLMIGSAIRSLYLGVFPLPDELPSDMWHHIAELEACGADLGFHASDALLAELEHGIPLPNPGDIDDHAHEDDEYGEDDNDDYISFDYEDLHSDDEVEMDDQNKHDAEYGGDNDNGRIASWGKQDAITVACSMLLLNLPKVKKLGIFSSPGVVSDIPSLLRVFGAAQGRADELLPALESLAVAVALQSSDPYRNAEEYYMYDDVVSKMSDVMRPARELFVSKMQVSCAPGRGFWSTLPRLEHLSALTLSDVPVNSGFTAALRSFDNLSKFVYVIDTESNLSRHDPEFVSGRRIVEALAEKSSHALRTLCICVGAKTWSLDPCPRLLEDDCIRSLENFVNLENLWINSNEFHYLTTEPLSHAGTNDTDQEQRNSLLMTLPPSLKCLHIWNAPGILKLTLFWLAAHCKPGKMLDEVVLGRYEGQEDLSPLYEAFREVGVRASTDVNEYPELW